MIKINKFFFGAFLLVMFVLPGVSLAQPASPEDPDFVDPTPVLPSTNTGQIYPAPFANQNPAAYNKCFTNMDDLGDWICRMGELLNSFIPVLIALAVLYFVWGVVQYVIGDSEEAKTKGKDRIIYGIVGFAVIIGMWGLVALVVNTFGVQQNAPDINITSFTFQDGTVANGSGVGCNIGNNPKLQNLLGWATCLIAKSVIPLIFMVAIASFVWGVVQYFLLGGDSDEKRAQGRQFIMWGIIALTVMICVWGLVSLLTATFGFKNVIPQVMGQ